MLFQGVRLRFADPIQVLIFFSKHLFFRLKAPGQELAAGSGISSICLLERFCEV